MLWSKTVAKAHELDVSDPVLPLDLTINGIQHRFDQPSYQVYSRLESLLVKAGQVGFVGNWQRVVSASEDRQKT